MIRHLFLLSSVTVHMIYRWKKIAFGFNGPVLVVGRLKMVLCTLFKFCFRYLEIIMLFMEIGFLPANESFLSA